MSDRNKKEEFVKNIKESNEILVDWFVKYVEQSSCSFQDILDSQAKLAFYLLEDDMVLKDPIMALDGKIVFFVTAEGSGEVAFQPNEKSFIEFKDFKFDEKFNDDKVPQLWTMFQVDGPEGWTNLIPHNFSDVIDFSKDHTISIDRVNPRYVNDGISMEIFAADALELNGENIST